MQVSALLDFSDASNFEVRTGSGAQLRCQQLVGVENATRAAYPVLGASWVWKSNQTFHKHYTSKYSECSTENQIVTRNPIHNDC